MRAVLLSTLLLSVVSYSAAAADGSCSSRSCRLDRAGVCIVRENDWYQICSSNGEMNTDTDFGNERDCIAFKAYVQSYSKSTGEELSFTQMTSDTNADVSIISNNCSVTSAAFCTKPADGNNITQAAMIVSGSGAQIGVATAVHGGRMYYDANQARMIDIPRGKVMFAVIFEKSLSTTTEYRVLLKFRSVGKDARDVTIDRSGAKVVVDGRIQFLESAINRTTVSQASKNQLQDRAFKQGSVASSSYDEYSWMDSKSLLTRVTRSERNPLTFAFEDYPYLAVTQTSEYQVVSGVVDAPAVAYSTAHSGASALGTAVVACLVLLGTFVMGSL